MIAALVLLPAFGALLALVLRSDKASRLILPMFALLHLAGVAICAYTKPPSSLFGWLELDPLGLWFLGITSGLFLAVSVYAVGYLEKEGSQPKADFFEGTLFENAPQAVFVASLLGFLAAMTLVLLAQHLAVLWVAVEATTLASAPLIFFHRHHRSLEATWKYLVVCSVGIALALVGTFFLGVAAGAGHRTSLLLGDLQAHAESLDGQWLKIAFIFLLVGYGTKLGLAPLHSWLPDAHAEAPSLVSALLSGALLNCAFVAVLRVHGLLAAAGLGSFSSFFLRLLGLVSLVVAVLSLFAQQDFKRLLAYSSVKHMGILALAASWGAPGVFASLLHALNHSLTKAALFLLSGNILAAYKTKGISQVRGLSRTLPVTGMLWAAGFFAIAGSPPFGLFLAELATVRAGLRMGDGLIVAAFVVLVVLGFVAMGRAMLGMASGEAPGAPHRERWGAVVPSLILLFASLALGLVPPGFLVSVAETVAAGVTP